ncbi:MAG: threonine-phosphate decarboxylase CobD [Pseudomonadota bacterium]
MSDDLIHGGALDRVAAAFPSAPTPWVDLSTGINPWPWPVESIDTECLNHLPTRGDIDRCREAMAAAFGAPAAALTPVPGTELAIRLLPQIIAARRVAVLAPSYGDHADSWRAADVELVTTADPMRATDGADVVVVCNPNNPDGRRFNVTDLQRASERLAGRSGWLIVDEAYADLDPANSLAPVAGSEGLIVLRSTGKFFGLAGLRLGAVLAPATVIKALDRLLGVWRVSGPALAVGAKLYADRGWQQAMRTRLAAARQRLDDVFVSSGLTIAGGTDLFRYVAIEDAHATWHGLCEHGIYTRRFAWTTSHLRVGLPATPATADRLAAALQAISR